MRKILAALVLMAALFAAYKAGIKAAERDFYLDILQAEIFSVDLPPEAENTRIFLGIGDDIHEYSLQLY